MKEKLIWIIYVARDFMRRAVNILMKRLKIKYAFNIKYKNKQILQLDETQNKIKELILAGEPAMVSRFGAFEARCIMQAIGIKQGIIKKFKKDILYRINFNAGVFPYGQEMALRFGEISKSAAKQVDLLGEWSVSSHDYLVNYACSPDVVLTKLGNLEPYYSEFPWTAALKGKRVLVVHPFVETIKAQYEKREMLFDNPDMLPDFELKLLRSVQTIAGENDARFDNWEHALEYMYQEAMKIDFDVALIGCGAYGMPLAAKLKESGKIAIHLGGATQLLFGIKGARWDNNSEISKLYNAHWVRPMKSETPEFAKKVEGACYW